MHCRFCRLPGRLVVGSTAASDAAAGHGDLATPAHAPWVASGSPGRTLATQAFTREHRSFPPWQTSRVTQPSGATGPPAPRQSKL
jgi:hypothetical protein